VFADRKASWIVSVVMVLSCDWRTAGHHPQCHPPCFLLIRLDAGCCLPGWKINTNDLGGLVVAIGSVVRRRHVDMENCLKPACAATRAAVGPANPLQVVFDTSVQVRPSR